MFAMTRKQRLMKKLYEIEHELSKLSAELEKLTLKKKSEAKSASEEDLFTWIENHFFGYGGDADSYKDKIFATNWKALNNLRTFIDYVELKEPVKVVYQLNAADKDVLVGYMEKKQFEKVQDFYVQCPSCGAWVSKHSYKCCCDYHFNEFKLVVEFTQADGTVHRHIKNEYGTEYELIENGETHPAEWVLTPIEKQTKEQNGGDTDGEHIQKAQELT